MVRASFGLVIYHQHDRSGPGPENRRTELERLLDHTVLGPTHPELGTCWQFTGTTTPYGRSGRSASANVPVGAPASIPHRFRYVNYRPRWPAPLSAWQL